MIDFTSIALKGLLVWTKIPIADDSKPKQKTQKKGLPKVYDKVCPTDATLWGCH